MKIGILTSIHTQVLQHCASDLALGFRQLGHECEVLHENTKWTDYDGSFFHPEDTLRFIDEYMPEVLIQFDGLRTNHPRCGIPNSIPWVCWVLDRLPWLYDKRCIQPLGNKDYTLAMWPEVLTELLAIGYPKETTVEMPIGVNTEIYNTTPCAASEKYDCDIAFVTRLVSQMPKSRIENRMNIARIAISLGVNVGLFGDGWDEYDEFKSYYRGRVNPGSDLCQCYQRAVLHIHANENTNWHMRTLEVMATGGRMAIYDCHDEPRGYPAPYAYTFERPEQLRRILESIKSVSSQEHKDISLAQYEWIDKYHSWKVRAKQILDLIKE